MLSRDFSINVVRNTVACIFNVIEQTRGWGVPAKLLAISKHARVVFMRCEIYLGGTTSSIRIFEVFKLLLLFSAFGRGTRFSV